MSSVVIVWLGFPQESPISFVELKQKVLLLLISCLEINKISCNNEKGRNCKRQVFYGKEWLIVSYFCDNNRIRCIDSCPSLTSPSAVTQ